MNVLKIYIVSILSLSLIISTSGIAEFCSCNHEVNIRKEVSTNLNCCETNEVAAQETMSCCSSNGNNIANNGKNKKCDDLDSSCTVCKTETFLSSNNSDAILVENISSSFKVLLNNVQLVFTNDDIIDSKKITFLKFLQTKNLSNQAGKDILISIHKLKIPLPALA